MKMVRLKRDHHKFHFFVLQIPDFCDFEEPNICNWKHDDGADFEWKWQAESTGSAETGPSYDHTYQTSLGHYLFIEASSPRVSCFSCKEGLYVPGVCDFANFYTLQLVVLEWFLKINDRM